MRFDKFVEMSRARRRIGKLHPAGISLPKSAHTFLEIVVWISHAKTDWKDNKAERGSPAAPPPDVRKAYGLPY
jgi:hypothetical protein